VVDLLRDRNYKQSRQAGIRLRCMLPAILAFAIGALAGAFGVAMWKFWCLLVPIAILMSISSIGRSTSKP
jgi:uncharacterized membrane protein YoaK (UPF0700 family)